MFKLKDSLFCLFLINAINFDGVSATCPDPELLKPCRCLEQRKGEIYCNNVTGAQMKEAFNKFGESQNEVKYFSSLILEGPGCDQVLDNTFDKISFGDIKISSAPNLAKIHTNAFKMSKKTLFYINIRDTPALDTTNLFDIINQTEKLNWLVLEHLAKLDEIPSLAFKKLNNLEIIRLLGTSLKKINEKAFYNLISLKILDLINTSLTNIGENVFIFSEKSEYTLDIHLFGNRLLDCNSFSAHTFSGVNRPLLLDFGTSQYNPNMSEYTYSKQMTCLPEQVFRPFFEVNNKNIVDLKDMDFDCNNCESVWLKNATQYHQRILNIKCQNGTKLDDVANFKDC